jgi:hypothetical protein
MSNKCLFQSIHLSQTTAVPVLPFGQELTLSLLATIIIEVDAYRAYAQFSALLPCLYPSWKSCSVSVQHRLRFFLHRLNYVKVAAFQFYFQSVEQRKVGGCRTTVILFLVQNSLVKKEVWDGALSWYNIQFFCRQNFGAESSRIFMQSP